MVWPPSHQSCNFNSDWLRYWFNITWNTQCGHCSSKYLHPRSFTSRIACISLIWDIVRLLSGVKDNTTVSTTAQQHHINFWCAYKGDWERLSLYAHTQWNWRSYAYIRESYTTLHSELIFSITFGYWKRFDWVLPRQGAVTKSRSRVVISYNL